MYTRKISRSKESEIMDELSSNIPQFTSVEYKSACCSVAFNEYERQITLYDLVSDSPGKGYGRELLLTILSWAVKNEFDVRLYAHPIGTAGPKMYELLKFYIKCGFEFDNMFVRDPHGVFYWNKYITA